MKLFRHLRQLYRKQDFNPDFWGLFTNPFYIARKGLYHSIKSLAPEITGNVLDVGCGRKPYRELFNYSEYVGMDIENPGHDHANEEIDIFYDGKHFPFSEEKFDNIVCNQVLEHVFEPEMFLGEINRVLKTGGHLLLTVPFVWDEHEQPNDYARYSSFALKHLLNQYGFHLKKEIKSVSDIRLIFQLINAYTYKKVMTKNKYLNFI
jgi:SAM-dependent methyltransferase